MAAPVTVGGMTIPNSVVVAILGFIFLYFMSIVVLTFLLIFGGLDFHLGLQRSHPASTTWGRVWGRSVRVPTMRA